MNNENTETIQLKQIDEGPDNTLKALLDGGAKEAYSRPWHRIERGLRLNRIRIFIEEISEEHNLTKEFQARVAIPSPHTVNDKADLLVPKLLPIKK